LRIVENLRKIHFDIAVIPHPSLRSSLLAYLAGIPCRVGFENRPGSVFFTHKAKYPLELHEVERNLQLAYLLGAPQGYYPLRVYISNKDKEFTREFIARNGILPEEIIIAINPCSVWDTKRWLPEGFAQVGDILTNELGAKIILVGGVEDGWLVEKVSLLMKTKPVLAVGRLTLKQLAGLMEYCKLFITNDSGPLHIAMAMKTPTVAIFGPTTPDLGFGPYGERYEIVEVKNLECRPCGKHGARRCPIKTFECMKQITPQQVVSAAKRLLMS
jgi:heptosyltransferase-2